MLIMSNLDLNSLPCFDVASAISKIPILQNVDIDEHVPSQINFNYYFEQDFLNCREISSLSKHDLFSTIHCNIRSLAANIVKLSLLLAQTLSIFCDWNFGNKDKTATRVYINQPRSQGFHMRTRRDTRKPWSGPVNLAF